MKKLVIGILAHVDAGKTTLSEGLLYVGGALRRLGRVDHGDAFLDTEELERERGITIVSKQARLPLGEGEAALLDTPGHVDFSAEMERTLSVLDYAILVVSGTDGVQSHTRTLWRLLERYQVPVFLFINKMDLPGAHRDGLLAQLRSGLDGSCVDFGRGAALRDEGVAECDEEALEQFVETGAVPGELTAALIRERKVFPCWFGSARQLEGVEEFLSGLDQYTVGPEYSQAFGARVFKISRDGQGTRLTWMKVTGGVLKAKAPLCGGAGDGAWEEKADQLRLYSGIKFQPVDQVPAGGVAAVTGLTRTYPGQGLGYEEGAEPPVLEPALTYRLLLPQGTDPHTVLPKLRQLEEEDPMLRIVWDGRGKTLQVQIMGQIQLEVLRRQILDRFGLEVDFGAGSIVYKETIAAPVEGMGHFEPLRHYAEVRLLLEPLPRGSGVRVASVCGDRLEPGWQRLILSHLLEREHRGVLTGAPLTDAAITLVAGRGHVKHTEGGDFRQATYRAVRQGLMQAETVLLEPVYEFRLELPADCVGRAMTDIQTMGGTAAGPEVEGELSVLTGTAPVFGLRGYGQEVTAYTRGLGRLSCTPGGWAPCHNQGEVAAQIGYDPEGDMDNPADSVFCAHGAGFLVKWNQVRDYMHGDSGLDLGEADREAPAREIGGPRERRGGSLEQDKQLQAIFERTYKSVTTKDFQPQRKPARTSLDAEKYSIREQKTGPEYLLVDGYNIIFAWEELEVLARRDLSAAREMLVHILANYQGFRQCVVILVFDAYKVKGNPGSIERKDGVYVVYTKEAETADAYIEKTTYGLGRDHRVRVATSDGLEQLIILGHGALRLSAQSLRAEVEQTQGEIARLIAQHNRGSWEGNQLRHTARVTEGKKRE